MLIATILMGTGEGGANPAGTLFMLFAFVGIFYFLLVRPQQKQRKAHEALVQGLKRGDEVQTAGGIIGEGVDPALLLGDQEPLLPRYRREQHGALEREVREGALGLVESGWVRAPADPRGRPGGGSPEPRGSLGLLATGQRRTESYEQKENRCGEWSTHTRDLVNAVRSRQLFPDDD